MKNSKNFDAKTFFNVIHEQSLINMGIEPTWNDLPKLQSALESAFDEIGGKHYTAICLSAEGLYHIHDVVTFEKTTRRNTVSKKFGNCHVEEMRGTKEQAENYILKKGKFEEKGEKILATFGDINAIKNNSGKRTDLNAFDIAVQSPDFDLNAYLLDNCTNEREERYLERRYARIKCFTAPNWRTVKVIYVEGASGSGKSRGANERYPKAFKASLAEKTNFPFNGYNGQDVLWLDELRPGYFKHAELMQILDGYKYNVDVKYGQFPALWTTVIITSVFKYNDWYKDNKGYFEDGRKEFERRIAERYIARNGEWLKVEKDINGNWHEPSQDFMPIDKTTDIPFLDA